MSDPASSPRPGRVWAHVGQPFHRPPAGPGEPDYDFVVVGAGRMGSVLACSLTRLAPRARVLLIEEGGLPNEDGDTILAAGVWTLAGLGEADQRAARGTRDLLLDLAGPVQGLLLDLSAEATPGSRPTQDVLRAHPQSLALLDPAALPHATPDPGALTYRPGTLALNAAQAAVRGGAALLLNTRAVLHPGGRVTAQRLTVTNTHQIVVHESHVLKAAQVILATGHRAPAQVEEQLGQHTRHARAYRQTPHLAVPSGPGAPVLRVGGLGRGGLGGGGLTLRPQHGAYTLYPPVHHRDPHGYEPAGGHLTGVPTGLRRETLEDLVALMDALPALATGALHLGRSLSDVPGTWTALPGGDPQARPLHERLDDHTTLLLGGPQADTLGPHTAHDLARRLAQEQERAPGQRVAEG